MLDIGAATPGELPGELLYAISCVRRSEIADRLLALTGYNQFLMHTRKHLKY